jgi:2-oxoisovalerate dehydrogenase E2 component (dihydrolipoyl transacylase)
MSGATIVVSNIGSIGGHVVAPVIMSPTVMILGIGQSRQVPGFVKGDDGEERIAKIEEVVLSWSADHRVLDGATVGRYAQIVASYLENVETLGVGLK